MLAPWCIIGSKQHKPNLNKQQPLSQRPLSQQPLSGAHLPAGIVKHLGVGIEGAQVLAIHLCSRWQSCKHLCHVKEVWRPSKQQQWTETVQCQHGTFSNGCTGYVLSRRLKEQLVSVHGHAVFCAWCTDALLPSTRFQSSCCRCATSNTCNCFWARHAHLWPQHHSCRCHCSHSLGC